jgi:hypothetical protein
LSQGEDRRRESRKEKEMNILLLKEHEDGSATYSFDMTIEERELLINFAIITAIKSGITEGSKYVGNIDVGDTQDDTI